MNDPITTPPPSLADPNLARLTAAAERQRHASQDALLNLLAAHVRTAYPTGAVLTVDLYVNPPKIQNVEDASGALLAVRDDLAANETAAATTAALDALTRTVTPLLTRLVAGGFDPVDEGRIDLPPAHRTLDELMIVQGVKPATVADLRLAEPSDDAEYAAFQAAILSSRSGREPELIALLAGVIHAVYPTATHVLLEPGAGGGPGGRLFLSGVEDGTGLIASEATEEPDNDDRYMPLCTAVQPVLEVLADYVSAGRISLTPPTGPAPDGAPDSLARQAELVAAPSDLDVERAEVVAEVRRAAFPTPPGAAAASTPPMISNPSAPAQVHRNTAQPAVPPSAGR